MRSELVGMVADAQWGGLYLVTQERSARIESREGIVWRVLLHGPGGPVHKLFVTTDDAAYVACKCCAAELGKPYRVQLADSGGNVLTGGLYDYEDSAMVQVFHGDDIDIVRERKSSGQWYVTMRGGVAV